MDPYPAFFLIADFQINADPCGSGSETLVPVQALFDVPVLHNIRKNSREHVSEKMKNSLKWKHTDNFERMRTSYSRIGPEIGNSLIHIKSS
jgi:hypothetical protein